MSARAAPQRHLANRHELRVSGSDSYALLFLFKLNDDDDDDDVKLNDYSDVGGDR